MAICIWFIHSICPLSCCTSSIRPFICLLLSHAMATQLPNEFKMLQCFSLDLLWQWRLICPVSFIPHACLILSVWEASCQSYDLFWKVNYRWQRVWFCSFYVRLRLVSCQGIFFCLDGLPSVFSHPEAFVQEGVSVHNVPRLPGLQHPIHPLRRWCSQEFFIFRASAPHP